MATVSEGPERFDECLLGFQNHDPQATDDFQKIVRPYIVNLAKKIARRLPSDLYEDVVSQTCLDLLGNSKKRFDPQRGSAKKFLVLAVRNAFREVCAQYCPPGQTTRAKKRADAKDEPPHTVVSLEEVARNLGSNQSEREIIARCQVDSLLRRAPERVAIALRKLHYSGDTLNKVAEDLNVSRFKLSREISAYTRQMQHIVVMQNVTFAQQVAC